VPRRRELPRRTAVELVVGHLNAEYRMCRNHLWFGQGDPTDAVLAATSFTSFVGSTFCCAGSSPLPSQPFNPFRSERTVLYGRLRIESTQMRRLERKPMRHIDRMHTGAPPDDGRCSPIFGSSSPAGSLRCADGGQTPGPPNTDLTRHLSSGGKLLKTRGQITRGHGRSNNPVVSSPHRSSVASKNRIDRFEPS
jgi:hypothetical protein